MAVTVSHFTDSHDGKAGSKITTHGYVMSHLTSTGDLLYICVGNEVVSLIAVMFHLTIVSHSNRVARPNYGT